MQKTWLRPMMSVHLHHNRQQRLMTVVAGKARKMRTALTLRDNLGPVEKRRKRKKKKANKEREKEKETEAIENSENSVKEDQYRKYIPLHKAALRGDWETAKRFFDQDEAAITARINKNLETALHVAVGTGKEIHFVKKLVELMSLEALKLCDNNGNTALNIAAMVGNTEAAAILVEKNPNLLYIRDFNGNLPIFTAAGYAQKDTLLYLVSVTKDDPVFMPFAPESGARFLKSVIFSGFYDVALNLVHRYPQLAKPKDKKRRCALGEIAAHESAFPSNSRLSFWQRLIYYYVPVKLGHYTEDHIKGDIENPVSGSQVIAQKYDRDQFLGKNFSISVSQKLQAMLWKVFELLVPQVKHIQEQKLIHLQALQLVKCLCKEIRSLNDFNFSKSFAKEALLAATIHGIREVVEEIVDSIPSLVWARDAKNCNIFQLAVIYRYENVFNLIYQMSEHKKILLENVDDSRNTILHFAGRLAPPNKLNLVSGEALQMQRELQWFKEVEKVANPAYLRYRNKDNETPAMVFTKAHKELVVKGEKWMKDTANSCTIAAALIVTIVFAAAVTVPGGNNGASGLPIFSKEKAFIIFTVSDAISLYTSTTSLLMFLSILTSRYAEADFLYALPKRLIIGLVTLFLSITSMMVAFSSTLYLMFGQNKAWIVIPVAALACLPVASFVSLQYPLLVDLISSTYGPSIFGRQSDRPFY